MNKRLWLSVVTLAIGAGLLVSRGVCFSGVEQLVRRRQARRQGRNAAGGSRRPTSISSIPRSITSRTAGRCSTPRRASCSTSPTRKRTAGGTKIAPEVATALPAISSNGKVYTFNAQEDVQVRRRHARHGEELRVRDEPRPEPEDGLARDRLHGRHRRRTGGHRRQGHDGQRHQGDRQLQAPDHADEGRSGLPRPDHDAVLLRCQDRHAHQPGRRLGAFEGHGLWPVLRVRVGHEADGDAVAEPVLQGLAARRTRIRSSTRSARRPRPRSCASRTPRPTSARSRRLTRRTLYNDFYVALGKKLNTGSKPSFVLRHQATFWYLNMNQDQAAVQEQRQAAPGRQLGDRPPADGPPARRQGRRRDVADPSVRLPGPQRQGRLPGGRFQEPELQQGQGACERQHPRWELPRSGRSTRRSVRLWPRSSSTTSSRSA